MAQLLPQASHMVEDSLAIPMDLPQFDHLQSLEELQDFNELHQLDHSRLQEDLEELVAL